MLSPCYALLLPHRSTAFSLPVLFLSLDSLVPARLACFSLPFPDPLPPSMFSCCFCAPSSSLAHSRAPLLGTPLSLPASLLRPPSSALAPSPGFLRSIVTPIPVAPSHPSPLASLPCSSLSNTPEASHSASTSPALSSFSRPASLLCPPSPLSRPPSFPSVSLLPLSLAPLSLAPSPRSPSPRSRYPLLLPFFSLALSQSPSVKNDAGELEAFL